MSIEGRLFARLAQGAYEQGCAELDAATDHLPEQFRAELDLDSAREFCLPLKTALQGLVHWLERHDALARPGGSAGFLRHVAETVPYYRKRGFARSAAAPPLSAFPVVTKAQMLAAYPDFISAGFHADPLKFFKSTSGTSGLPLIVWFDAACFYDVNYQTYRRVADRLPGLAEAVRPGRLGAIQLTDDPQTWPGATRLPSLEFCILARQLFGMAGIDDDAVMARMRTARPALICGVPSSLLAYLRHEIAADAATPSCRPRGIFVSGETLYDNARRLLGDWFGCPIVNAYTSTEGGLIAMECAFGRGLHVSGHTRVEILRDDGTVGDEGTGEVLLTNMMNRAQAIVRYRVGDRASVVQETCRCGYRGATITRFHGREPTHFRTPDREIDLAALDHALSALPLLEFQLAQAEPRRVWLRWVAADANGDSYGLAARINDIARHHFVGVDIHSEQVSRITAPGTKARRFITCEACDLSSLSAATASNAIH